MAAVGKFYVLVNQRGERSGILERSGAADPISIEQLKELALSIHKEIVEKGEFPSLQRITKRMAQTRAFTLLPEPIEILLLDY